jgi:hypothetical protein
VADQHRRAQVCQQANERYPSSLAAMEETTSLGELTRRLCNPVRSRGGQVRGLNPLSAPEARLLEATTLENEACFDAALRVRYIVLCTGNLKRGVARVVRRCSDRRRHSLQWRTYTVKCRLDSS